MILTMKPVGFFEDHTDFWLKDEEASLFFENENGRKFDSDIDEFDEEIIYKYYEQLNEFYHIEYLEFTTGFEVFRIETQIKT